jgi:hypothetical protein
MALLYLRHERDKTNSATRSSKADLARRAKLDKQYRARLSFMQSIKEQEN